MSPVPTQESLPLSAEPSKASQRPIQLLMPQLPSHSGTDSPPSTPSHSSPPTTPAFASASLSSSSSSELGQPISTPASSGAPSPEQELEQAHMLKSNVIQLPPNTPQNRDRVLFEQWRPTSHFLAPHGWMNDPCGPCYDPRTGLYHLWYQWNPNASTWGTICWGHAYSDDMIQWTSRPEPVLVPGGNNDSEGVFTGCVLPRGPLGSAQQAAATGQMTTLYTAVSKLPIHHTLPYNYGSEKLALSTSTDGGKTWIPQGLVLDGPPEHLDVISWRDPYIGEWAFLDALLGRTDPTPGLYGVIAGGIKDTTPTTFAYSINPDDLSQWTYIGTLVDVGRNLKSAPYGVDLGKNWEVANFFTIPDPCRPASPSEYLLINIEGMTEPGPARAPVYMKVDLQATKVVDGEVRLQPSHAAFLDHGCLYAASSFHDEKLNRRIMWGWITEDDLPESYYDTQGWAGCICLPRELFHHPTSSELGIRPAQEVSNLRQGAKQLCFTASDEPCATQVELTEAALGGSAALDAVPVTDVASRSYEIEMDLSPSQPGVVVAHNADLSTRTLIYISECDHLIVDRTHSAGKQSVIAKGIQANTCTLRAPLSPTQDGSHKIRLFLDNSVLEIFVDDLVVLSTRVYPDAQDNLLSVLTQTCHRQGQGERSEVKIWNGLHRAIVA